MGGCKGDRSDHLPRGAITLTHAQTTAFPPSPRVVLQAACHSDLHYEIFAKRPHSRLVKACFHLQPAATTGHSRGDCPSHGSTTVTFIRVQGRGHTSITHAGALTTLVTCSAPAAAVGALPCCVSPARAWAASHSCSTRVTRDLAWRLSRATRSALRGDGSGRLTGYVRSGWVT